ncbi:unnamed protein product [Sphagnum balticum]
MIGAPMEVADSLKKWSDAIANFMGNLRRNLPLGLEAQASITAMAQLVDQLIDERRKHPTDDLLSTLIKAEEEGKALTKQEMISIVIICSSPDMKLRRA